MTRHSAADHCCEILLRQTEVRPSLLICVANYTIVVLTVLSTRLDYVTSGSPLWIRILFYPFMMVTFFIFLPALAGVIIGIVELRSRSSKAGSAIAILGNVTLMIGYVIAVKALWPALMGV